MKVKNFGIWIRYDSRSGTHNMYREYRDMSRTDAVESMYQDMAARHRTRFRSVHVRSTQPSHDTYLPHTNHRSIHRFSRSSRFPRSTISAAPTSSSSSSPTSSSHCLTVFPARPARRSSPPAGPLPLLKGRNLCEMDFGGIRQEASASILQLVKNTGFVRSDCGVCSSKPMLQYLKSPNCNSRPASLSQLRLQISVLGNRPVPNIDRLPPRPSSRRIPLHLSLELSRSTNTNQH